MKHLAEKVLVGSIVACLMVFTVLVLFALADAQAQASEDLDPCGQELSLPEKCREFYNDGTDAWINCMGVGYK